MKAIVAFVIYLLLVAAANAQIAPPTPPIARGGSNFNWYKTDCTQYPPGGQEPFGVIVNYNTQTIAIRQALQNMRNAGQDKIRIMLFFGHGLSSGTVMDSAGGSLSSQNMSNLVNLIDDIHSFGFSVLHISFGALGSNDPTNWGGFNQAMADENWGVISSVHQAIGGTRGFDKIYYDLGNELMTGSQSNARYQYMKYIWPKYRSIYGTADSVGFSFASGEIAGGIDNIGAVFGHTTPPAAIEIHIYPYAGNSAQLLVANAATGLLRFPLPWYIGEANFNDEAEADAISQEINGMFYDYTWNGNGYNPPLYLMQWPHLSNNSSCTVSDVSPFNIYEKYGF
ncbi:MAG: hypothetical protein J0I77_20155 [Rudaea sp.]|uniref:hypothetical protein n=1 Tax=unclassified Rudaea TaxID=2627037 RepID=UPI0010F9D0F4|nr:MULTISPECIES: hypothetical protein [unclassified Rudaea]MBN8888037.1 hypothetical protein [Rudaea sp.]MBR0343669.1 hypothetical protein [Rudaea sp.]